MRRVYLDHAATSPMFQEAKAAMEPWLSGVHGNPSSLHQEGRKSKDALDESREAFAGAFGCEFSEVTFCSSATECASLALVGLALANEEPRKRFVVSAAEHSCVLGQAPILHRLGYTVDEVPVRPDSTVDLEQLESKLADDVLACVVMSANNETGAETDWQTVGALTKRSGVFWISDMVQSSPAEWKSVPADIGFVAPHKWGGPLGLGVLFTRYPAEVKALVRGGTQERERRAGTENVASVVGGAAALRYCLHNAGTIQSNKLRAKGAFLRALTHHESSLPQAPHHVPGIASLRFPGCSNETLLIKLDRNGVSASAGSACSSGSVEPSHVLIASGLSEHEAKQCLRFSFGADSTEEESAHAGEVVRSLTQVTPTVNR